MIVSVHSKFDAFMILFNGFVQIKEQHRGDLMTSGPKSHLLAGIVVDTIPGPVRTFFILILTICCPWYIGVNSPLRLLSVSVQRVFDVCLCRLHQAFIIEDEEQARNLPPNPFNQLTEKELDDYKNMVERKQQGQEGTSIHRSATLCPPHLMSAHLDLHGSISGSNLRMMFENESFTVTWGQERNWDSETKLRSKVFDDIQPGLGYKKQIMTH